MRKTDHDGVLSGLGFKARRISKVRLPVHSESGRMDGLIEYADDDGAAWMAEALRLRKENAQLRRQLAALQPDEERQARDRRAERNRAMYGR